MEIVFLHTIWFCNTQNSSATCTSIWSTYVYYKIKSLLLQYSEILVGDGNCFYRAILVGELERCLKDPEELKRSLNKFNFICWILSSRFSALTKSWRQKVLDINKNGWTYFLDTYFLKTHYYTAQKYPLFKFRLTIVWRYRNKKVQLLHKNRCLLPLTHRIILMTLHWLTFLCSIIIYV